MSPIKPGTVAHQLRMEGVSRVEIKMATEKGGGDREVQNMWGANQKTS